MERIVVGVDGSQGADRALMWAAREARVWDAAMEIVHCYVVHALGAVVYLPDEANARERLAAIVERNRPQLAHVKWSVDTRPVFSAPSAGLLDAAEDADLLVVGARGTGGFASLLLGSTAHRVAAHAPAPVVVVGDDAPADDGQRPLVVGVDGSRAGARALAWAVEEARRRGVDLTVVHAFQLPADPEVLRAVSMQRRTRLLQRIQQEAEEVLHATVRRVDHTSVAITPVVERGAAAAVLLARSGADRLLVVGTHGRGAVGRAVMGSVSRQCVHHAAGPVVVVP
jgi:nucleotide-binding universal stress UspA family protein